MTSARVDKALQQGAIVWVCVMFAVGAVWATVQPPAGSEGWRIPDSAATEQNPVPFDPVAVARGQALYRSKCQRCHGVDGKGHGPDADPKHVPGDLTDVFRAPRNPDGVMFYKIWNGRAKPKMPAMKSEITRIEVWTVIHYVKSLRRSDAHAFK